MTGQEPSGPASRARTFLIADIRGYTAFTVEHGDVAASRLTTKFAGIVAEGVEAWGGALVETRGDEALAVFESPTTALQAAVELQDAFADEVVADPSLPLHVGIGLDAGEAVQVGDGYRGSALNLAARLCGLSRSGEIHATVGLVDLAGPIEGIVFEEISGLDLKGFGAGQHACRVGADRPLIKRDLPPRHEEAAPDAALPAELVVDGPLAGRDAEMRWLGWHWRRARHGHSRVVLVAGPGGAGKTRLLAGLAGRAAADGARVRYVRDARTADPASTVPVAAHEGPWLLVIDDPDAPDRVLSAVQHLVEEDDGAGLLAVVVRRDDVDAGSPLPRLQVAPLALEGVRELAGAMAPEVVDELPLTRILEDSRGLPGEVRDAVQAWAERIEAERAATEQQEAAMPAERSSFVGRTDELETAARLLGSTRLLTLVGPPGTGKTRLALRMARDHAADNEAGSFFVPLAAVGDPRFIGSAIARSLKLRESKDASALDVVKAYLAERKALLVLDNYEHLLEGAPQVAELLDTAPDLRVVATSRAPLGLSGEQVYPVPPLALPPVADEIDPDDLRNYDAAALFIARAQAADPGFDVDEQNAATIASITTALDGLPLAIELAAARVRSLPPKELLRRLEGQLRILTGGPADGADRHRTMRDAIAWSYELLSEDERSLVRSLGVFRGGFTLAAAAAVAQRPDAEILDGIDSLVAKSLLNRPAGGGGDRFSMLEMIREFAIDALDTEGEHEAATARHAQVYAALGQEVQPLLEGEDLAGGLARLGPEVDNIRAALDHAMSVRQAGLGLTLAASIWRFWQSMGQLEEGSYWLGRMLSLDGGSNAERAGAYAALGGLAYWQGDFQAAEADYEQACELLHACGDRYGEAEAIYSLSLVRTYTGDLERAERLADDARAMFDELGAHDKVADVLMAQGTIAWRRGDLPRAQVLFERALGSALSRGDKALAASQLTGVAGLRFLQGEGEAALRTAAEGLSLAIESGNTHTQIFALDAIASLAAIPDPAAAVRLCSAAATLREAHGGGWTLEDFGVASARTAATESLGEAEIDAAWEAGRSWELDDAIRSAWSILKGAGVESERLDPGS